MSVSTAHVSLTDYVLAPNASIKDFGGVFGPAQYRGTDRWHNSTAQVDAAAQDIEVEMTLPHSTGPPAYACGPGTGTSLQSLITENSTQNEIKMLSETNWVHLALGAGSVYV